MNPPEKLLIKRKFLYCYMKHLKNNIAIKRSTITVLHLNEKKLKVGDSDFFFF